MRAIYNNTDFDAATLTASSEETNYEATNLQDINLDKTWRTTNDATEYIVLDAGVGNTFTVDCVSILGHNLTNAATIKFQMHTADAWGAPDLDEAITWRSDTMVKYFTSTSKRYARFYFEDAANTDGYIEIGRLFMSAYLQFNPSSLANFTIANIRNDIQSVSITNSLYSDKGVGYRQFKYSFPKTDYNEFANIRTMYNLIGKHTPFVFMNYDTRFTEIAPAYVAISRDLTERWRGHNKIEYRLQLREVR
jgi:hypothetical protein